jgi:MOSC domain-containing protein YiiM
LPPDFAAHAGGNLIQQGRMKVLEIHISPGHNFFGHYGSPPGKQLTVPVADVECVAGQGLRGDRFFGHQENYKGQVTFFSVEVYRGLCEHLNIHDKAPKILRRNVLTSGINLNSLVGKEFDLQGIRFAGVAECSPCFWMNEAFGPGAEDYLRGHGGLRARILTTGLLRVEP